MRTIEVFTQHFVSVTSYNMARPYIQVDMRVNSLSKYDSECYNLPVFEPSISIYEHLSLVLINDRFQYSKSPFL